MTWSTYSFLSPPRGDVQSDDVPNVDEDIEPDVDRVEQEQVSWGRLRYVHLRRQLTLPYLMDEVEVVGVPHEVVRVLRP